MTEKETRKPDEPAARERAEVNVDGTEVKVSVSDRRRLKMDDQDPATPAEASAPDAAAELEEAKRQAAGHLEDLQRLKAEFENYRKRVMKEQTHLIERASSEVVERLLPVLDNFELALMAADRTKDYESMVHGVEIVYGELLELLHKEGLRKIEALGKPFDPELHEAVMQIDEGDGELVVVDEMRSGYTLGGRVIRPAMVKVGRSR